MARRHRTERVESADAASRAEPITARKSAEPTDYFRCVMLAGATALLVARPLVPSDGGPWVGDGQIGAALWIALGALWVVASMGKPRLRFRFGWIDAAMIAFTVWWAASAMAGISHAAPRPSVNMLWEGIANLIAFLLLRQLIEPFGAANSSANSGRESRAMVAVMIAVGVVLALSAMYQYFVSIPAAQRQFAEHPAAVFREAQVEVAQPGTHEFQTFADRVNSTEPFATFGLTNSLAAYLAPWLVIAFGLIALGLRLSPSEHSWSSRDWLGVAVSAALIAVALALTRSRSAWIGTIVGLTVVGVWRFVVKRQAGQRTLQSKWLWGAACAFVMAVVAAAIIIAVRPQALEPATRSFAVRIDYWRATCRMIADRPWLGVGPGNFGEYYTQYKLPGAWEEIRDPHNFIFEVAASAGLPAIALLLAVLGGFFVRLWRRGAFVAATTSTATVDASPNSDHSVYWIFGGAIVGFWLAVGWSFVTGFNYWPEDAVLRMFVAGAVFWLLWPWIDCGTLRPRLIGVGVATLLIALLAVGGITFGGVNETLWLLLAIGLIATDRKRPMAAESVRSWPWIWNVPLLVGVVLLWYAQHQAAYEPVLGCQGALEAAREFGPESDVTKQEQLLRLAAEADPLAVEPRRQLANLQLLVWLRGAEEGHRTSQITQSLLAAFEKWSKAALELNPQSASLHLEAGTAWRLVFSITGIDGDGRKALRLCRRAAELYPNGVVVQFELAETLAELSAKEVNDAAASNRDAADRAAADFAAAKVAAREALRLDGLRPQTERALGEEQRKLAERIISGDNPLAVKPKPPAKSTGKMPEKSPPKNVPPTSKRTPRS